VDKIEIPKLLIISIFLLLGAFAHAIGKKTKIPRVTLLLIMGIVIGPSVFDVIPHEISTWFPSIAHVALAMVGFLLGESFLGKDLKQSGKTVLFVSIGETIGAAFIVFCAVYLFANDLTISLLLCAIAPASAPAATLDVIKEGHSKGPLTKTVLGVVAIDDAWGVILFSLFLVAAESIVGQSHQTSLLLKGLWEVGGAVLLGIGIGLPMAWFTGRIKPGEPTLIEAAGFIFICGGIAQLIEVSYLLSCMTLGATVANRAKHHTRPFREIEGASEPFLIAFFILAGYEFDLASIKTLGFLSLIYILSRSVGLIFGGRLGARSAKASNTIQKHVGWCLLPQAGVALGLALFVTERLPDQGEVILPLIIGTTVVFELIGPVMTRFHLKKSGEINDNS